ncbi:MAG: hypothetical protein WCI73_04600 [Phycisphaerae bacterium]
MKQITESAIHLLPHVFSCGTRDFRLLRHDDAGQWVDVDAFDLLGLDRAADVIVEVKRTDQPRAMDMALRRLLVPCLRYRGSTRHIVAEEWDNQDLSGVTLPADTRTPFAKKLMYEQMDDWQLIIEKRRPPKGTLAETLWEALTALPRVPPQADDQELWRFTKALYFFLVPEGTGNFETSSTEIETKLNLCRKRHWLDLDLGVSPRRLNSLFPKLLTLAAQWASQLSGEVAYRIVNDRLRQCEEPLLTTPDRRLLDFRYGVYPDLGCLNIAFMHGNGSKFNALVNYLFCLEASGADVAARQRVLRYLHEQFQLLAAFRKRRKQARAQEKRDNRQRRSEPAAGKDSKQADQEADSRAIPPDRIVEARDSLASLFRDIMPLLRKPDAQRVRAMLATKGDRAAAAKRLGITHGKFSRQWRQTTMPTVRRLMAERRRKEAEDD